MQRFNDGTEAGLRCIARKCVHRCIHDIHARIDCSKHGRRRNARRIMCVEMDRQIGFLAQRLEQHARGGRLQQARHILDRNNMRASLFHFLRQIDVIIKVVFGAIRVQNIARIADRRFTELVFLQHRIHRHAHVLNPVEAVENAEQVNARARCLAHEIFHHIVRIGFVANPVRTAQKHLQQEVGRAFAHQCQTLPRVFGQEAHGDVESSPAPAFQREQVWQRLRVSIGDPRNIIGAHARGKQ
ncbi:Uncharacterised protein [Brucella neotomae]|nr:Uncharacterised protein [Brucella neotomae]